MQLPITSLTGILLFLSQPQTAALSAFDSYTRAVEASLDRQHISHSQNGELIVEQLSPAATDLPGALLHHWRATAFAPGAKAADFERLLRDVDSYPRHFSPQVVQAQVLTRDGDRMQTKLRLRQRNIITVELDSTYEVTFVQLDKRHGYSTSRSTDISEIEPGGDHGFLWRLNTYWSYEERDGGLYLQIETVSLTRAIPRGLGWLIEPWVKRIPRESLEFTLRCALEALRRAK